MNHLALTSRQQKITYTLLTALRMAIGWHFLYEGLVKLLNPGWTAAGYLESSTGPLAALFQAMAGNEMLLAIINVLNTWGLVLIGLGLILGIFTKLAQGAGMALLLIYWASHPPIMSDPGFFREGSYFFVSKDLLEAMALLVLMFVPTSRFFGLDALLNKMAARPKHIMDHGQAKPAEVKADVRQIERREVLKHLATVPFLGAVVFGAIRKTRMHSLEESQLTDASSGATQRFVQNIMAGSSSDALKNLKGKQFTSETDQLKGTLPRGFLGHMESSKLILGGNLLSGYVHSRDLIYVSSLVQNYHQKDRIFRTLMLAEQSGVNTLLSNPVVMPLMEEYWKEGYGKIQFISDMAGLDYSDWKNGPRAMDWQQYQDIVKGAIDSGATSGYVQGETADFYMEHNQPERIDAIMDIMRQNKLPVGIGAHKIETIKRIKELGIQADFWMKTLHTHDYWSAKHPTWHDNMYCFDPDETISYMESLEEPWIAFKTLAAGAIKPQQAFEYALQNGADFLCVGMYDFQIIDDVNIALAALDQVKDRRRPWRA